MHTKFMDDSSNIFLELHGVSVHASYPYTGLYIARKNKYHRAGGFEIAAYNMEDRESTVHGLEIFPDIFPWPPAPPYTYD